MFGKLLKRNRPDTMPVPGKAKTIHFLHVGKAAGSQIGDIIKQIEDAGFGQRILNHRHKTGLAKIPAGDDYFFSTRDPVTRFKSAFYSRKRQGRPRHHREWTAHEAIAFERFQHANDLAEALFDPGQSGLEAAAAMHSISHCSRNFVDWIKPLGQLFSIRPPIWIVRQEHFERDLRELLRRIGFDGPVEISNDDHRAHRNSYENTPDLSAPAVENLRRWYAQDHEFLRLCQNWMETNATTDGNDPERPIPAEIGVVRTA